ncbi:hypothetical protein BJV78DRAFT_1365279 [Lactifluus subvellereus]|nr:hypothetical protein BJV78DRAFT_1365279 [Lactifluus subvellereus]
MSLLRVEDETRSVNPERRDPEHLGKVDGINLDNYDDPNFDPTGSILQDDSPPYAEVRSAVANTDDPIMPSSTFRAWVVGIILVVLISVVNQVFWCWLQAGKGFEGMSKECSACSEKAGDRARGRRAREIEQERDEAGIRETGFAGDDAVDT